jgi:hypothetical protein
VSEREYTLPELLHCEHMTVEALEQLGREYERWRPRDPWLISEELATMMREEHNFDVRASDWLQVCGSKVSPLEFSSFFKSLPHKRINEDGTMTVSSHPFVPPNQPWYRRHASKR